MRWVSYKQHVTTKGIYMNNGEVYIPPSEDDQTGDVSRRNVRDVEEEVDKSAEEADATTVDESQAAKSYGEDNYEK